MNYLQSLIKVQKIEAQLEAERQAETASKLAEIAAFDAEIASEQERLCDELHRAGTIEPHQFRTRRKNGEQF